jgi:hypothetical protein
MPYIDGILLEMISHELTYHTDNPLYEHFLLSLVEQIFELQDPTDEIEESWTDEE